MKDIKSFPVTIKVKGTSKEDAKRRILDIIKFSKLSASKIKELKARVEELEKSSGISELGLNDNAQGDDEYKEKLIGIITKLKDTNSSLRALYDKEKKKNDKLSTSLVGLFFALIFIFSLGMYLLMGSITIMVNGRSMENTIMDGDEIIVDKLIYKAIPGFLGGGIDRQDIVVFTYEGNFVIKRIIAKSGDTVEVTPNAVIVLDKDGNEIYKVQQETNLNEYNIQLGEGEYFVLGDNLYTSEDSRRIGPIKEDQIVGKYMFIIPFK